MVTKETENIAQEVINLLIFGNFKIISLDVVTLLPTNIRIYDNWPKQNDREPTDH